MPRQLRGQTRYGRAGTRRRSMILQVAFRGRASAAHRRSMGKHMFGTRGADGELAVARLLAVTRTCQLRRLNVLVYLTAAIHAHRRRQPAASLLTYPETEATRPPPRAPANRTRIDRRRAGPGRSAFSCQSRR
jgi:hypothetical protein